MTVLVHIDYVDDPDVPAVMRRLEVLPRIGEKIGVRQPGPMAGTKHYVLDTVVDVRHYAPEQNGVATGDGYIGNMIHVLTSSR